MASPSLSTLLASAAGALVLLSGVAICGDEFFGFWAYPLGFALLGLWCANVIHPMTADAGASQPSVMLERLLFVAAFFVAMGGVTVFCSKSDPSFGVSLYLLSVVLGLSAAMHAWIDRRYARPFLQLVERSRGPRSWAAEAREIAGAIENPELRIKLLELAGRCEFAVSDLGYPTPLENEQISMNFTRMHAAGESRNWSVLAEMVEDTTRLLSLRENYLRRTVDEEEGGDGAVERWNAL